MTCSFTHGIRLRAGWRVSSQTSRARFHAPCTCAQLTRERTRILRTHKWNFAPQSTQRTTRAQYHLQPSQTQDHKSSAYFGANTPACPKHLVHIIISHTCITGHPSASTPQFQTAARPVDSKNTQTTRTSALHSLLRAQGEQPQHMSNAVTSQTSCEQCKPWGTHSRLKPPGPAPFTAYTRGPTFRA